jgi:hypothetical protein
MATIPMPLLALHAGHCRVNDVITTPLPSTGWAFLGVRVQLSQYSIPHELQPKRLLNAMPPQRGQLSLLAVVLRALSAVDEPVSDCVPLTRNILFRASNMAVTLEEGISELAVSL